jgi:1,4-dihydroxy-2-naphthoyl-CoA synthase
MGMKRAKEMHLLLPRYTAQEAFQMGLANKIVPLDELDEEVDQWCEKLFQVSPSCIQLRKMSFNSMIDMLQAFTGPFGDLLNKMHPDFLNSEERKECLQAFFEKRRPMCFKKYVEEHTKASP